MPVATEAPAERRAESKSDKPQRVRFVLTAPRMIGGQEREPGFVLLEAPCPRHVLVADIDKALLNGAAAVLPVD